MTIKTIHTLLLAVILSILPLSGCDSVLESKVGDWAKMKWETTNYASTTIDGHSYTVVPSEGGTFVYHCKNYRGFWIAGFYEDDGEDALYSNMQEGMISDFYHVKTEHCDVTTQGDTLRLIFAPSTESHNYRLEVTAGDIFCTFRFVQNH